MEKLSFVIPCYRSEKSIGKVVKDIIVTVEKDGRYDYEIICVNDHSPDNTLDVLIDLSQNPRVKVIDLMKNFGQHSALMAGYNCVSGDIVVSLDDDGQNPPSEVFRMIDKLQEGNYDLVSAKYTNKRHSLYRRLGSKVSMAMSRELIGMPKGIDLNSYCVFKRIVAEEIVKYKNSYPFVHGLMLRVTRNIANVEIQHKNREEGNSGYSFGKLLGLMMNGFTAFSVKPLRMASILGALVACGGFIFGLYIIIRKLFMPEILSGYSSLMAAILFIGGIIMMLLGLMGEYIGRIYISINNAPQFAIRSLINMTEENYTILESSPYQDIKELKKRAIKSDQD